MVLGRRRVLASFNRIMRPKRDRTMWLKALLVSLGTRRCHATRIFGFRAVRDVQRFGSYLDLANLARNAQQANKTRKTQANIQMLQHIEHIYVFLSPNLGRLGRPVPSFFRIPVCGSSTTMSPFVSTIILTTANKLRQHMVHFVPNYP